MNYRENLEQKRLLLELEKVKKEKEILDKENKIKAKKIKDSNDIITDLQKDIDKTNKIINTLSADNCRVKYTQTKQQLEVVNNIVKEKDVTIDELKKK